jgi:hypothetical protein
MKPFKDWTRAHSLLPGGIKLAFWVILLLWAGWFLLGYFGEDTTGKGQFGDHFGALNALFSGLTCLGLSYTIYQQWQLNERQDKERKADNVEDRFFSLTSGLRDLMSSLSGTVPAIHSQARNQWEMVTGKAVFEGIVVTINLGPPAGPDYTLAQIKECQQMLFSKYANAISPFVATIKYILRYLDRDGGARTTDYVSLLAAELSPAETIILAIWPLGKKDEELRELLRKHNVIRYMPGTTRFGFSRQRIKVFYPQTHFEWEE